jgi:DNA-directed RNA polymerase
MDDFEQLAGQFSKLIFSIIHSLHIYKNEDEFYQIGLLALWDASKNFDHTKGIQFSTYAYHYIRGRMLTSLRKEKKREEWLIFPKEEYWGYLECEMRMLEKEDLLNHFHNLTDNQEKWVMYRYYYGLNNREIAERENLSLSAVRQWGNLAMKKVLLNK